MRDTNIVTVGLASWVEKQQPWTNIQARSPFCTVAIVTSSDWVRGACPLPFSGYLPPQGVDGPKGCPPESVHLLLDFVLSVGIQNSMPRYPVLADGILPKGHCPKEAHTAGCSPPEQRMTREWVCVKVQMDTLCVKWDRRKGVKWMGQAVTVNRASFSIVFWQQKPKICIFNKFPGNALSQTLAVY